MKTNIKLQCLTLLIVLAFAACTNDDETVGPQDEENVSGQQAYESAIRDLTIIDHPSTHAHADAHETEYMEPYTEAEAAQARSLRKFAFRFVNGVMEERAGQNVFVSPLSAHILLSLIANGASGDTQSEVMSLLGTDSLGAVELLNSYNKKTAYRMLTIDDQITLKQSNAAWMQYTLPVYSSYADAVEGMYDANLVGIDFHSPSAGTSLNDWCRENTDGLIDHIVNDGALDGYSLVLANALYFNAKWFSQFNENKTTQQTFHNFDGSESTVDMMQQKGHIRYVSTDLYDVAILQLGHYMKRFFAMHILLPHNGVSLSQCLSTLDADTWSQLVDDPTSIEGLSHVDLWLPRFNMNMIMSIKQVLQGMGMHLAFDAVGADFQNLSPSHLYISDLLQSTSLEVTESGVEAAAVTYGGWYGAMPGYKPTYVTFHVDRPFFFTLQDNYDGSILFAGVVNKL